MSSNQSEGLSFWEHLSELIKHLRRGLYAFIISTLVVMVFPIRIDLSNIGNPFYQTITSAIINHLQDRFLTSNVNLVPLSFFAPLEVYFFISLIVGAAISLPVIAYELFRFLNPALYTNEKRFALRFILSFVSLFLFGSIFGYLYVVPLTFQTMLTFSSLMQLSLTYHFAEFYSMAGMILLLCGLLFTFPIYIYVLVRVGILKTEYLTKNRKYMYGIILIIIAVVDPDPSLVTEGLTFIPIVILTEISILISKRLEKSRITS